VRAEVIIPPYLCQSPEDTTPLALPNLALISLSQLLSSCMIAANSAEFTANLLHRAFPGIT